MTPIPQGVRGLWFEEFELGQQVNTAGRTVTETDVVNFAGVSGDFNQIHTDEAFSKNSSYGQRVAHGLLVLSIATGLVLQTGVLEGTVMAFREIDSWKFSKPVFIGDTVHVEAEIIETKPMKKMGAGLVAIELSVINQHGDKVMKGRWSTLVLNKPAD